MDSERSPAGAGAAAANRAAPNLGRPPIDDVPPDVSGHAELLPRLRGIVYARVSRHAPVYGPNAPSWMRSPFKEPSGTVEAVADLLDAKPAEGE